MVVIGILAAITIVAYNGITQRAKDSAAASAAEQAAKKVMAYAITNTDAYPTALSDAGITDANGTSYQYRVDNSSSPATFCLTATSGNVSYWASSTAATPTAGACAGHAVNGGTTVTNLSTNPSAESNLTGWSTANGTTISRDSSAAIDGSFGVRAVSPATATQDSGVTLSMPSAVTAGLTRTISVKIRATTADTYRLSLQGTTFFGPVDSIALAAGQTGTLQATRTFPASGSAVVYVLRSTINTSQTFDVDSLMVIDGGATSTFADGNSAGWTWNGGQNNSTSTGPPR